MPIIAHIGRRQWKGRLATAGIYAALVVLGATMIYPFLITISSSVANDYDYDRFAPLPRYLWSRSDRFVKGLTRYNNLYPDWDRQLRCQFRQMPAHWSSWPEIGRDKAGVGQFARPYLDPSPADRARWKTLAADYAEFVAGYPVADMQCTVLDQESVVFLRDRFKTLDYANRMVIPNGGANSREPTGPPTTASRELGPPPARSWEDFSLSASAPAGVENRNLRSVWADFATTLPAEQRGLTSAEHRFQSFLLARYGSLEKINTAYGWRRARLEEVFPPFDVAYAVAFHQHERAHVLGSLWQNYAAVADFLQGRGNALVVTAALIALAILAINALSAFLWAYNSWEWALIICQQEKMWTLAVWLYQANQWWGATPWISTAGFVVVSLPTLLVFLFCQKIILRGIILPSMK